MRASDTSLDGSVTYSTSSGGLGASGDVSYSCWIYAIAYCDVVKQNDHIGRLGHFDLRLTTVLVAGNILNVASRPIRPAFFISTLCKTLERKILWN
jgi:hypothetical protein